MSVPGSANALLLNTAAAGGYQISRSLRFNSSDSAYLSRTPASAGNRKTWTWAGWVKRSAIAANQYFFGCNVAQTNSQSLYFSFAEGAFNVLSFGFFWRTTTALFRDPSAWYHVVVAVDTTQATANNRIRVYINGIEQTSFSTLNNPSQNADLGINQAGAHVIGDFAVGGNLFFNGYLADIHFCDGTAYDASAFGEFDTNGIFQPKKFTGTYGSQGWKLDFADNSSNTATTLGKDTSGNGNNWTPNNLSVTAGAGNDSLVDVPTNYGTDTGVGGEVRGNYCTLNPLASDAASQLSNGNLVFTGAGSVWKYANTTIGLSSGKWYWEAVCTDNSQIGVVAAPGLKTESKTTGTITFRVGNYWVDGAQTSTSTFAAGNVIGFALDLDSATKTLKQYANGALVNTINIPVNATWNNANVFAGTAVFSSTYVDTFNFGQRPFAYTAPSGFKALCTANLPAPVVTKPSSVFDVVTYTGTGSTLTPTSSLGFNPDLVWIKSRSAATDHTLYDSVRGAQARLESNTTDAEVTSDNGLTAFNSNGFTLGTLAQVNTNAATYVGWTWDAGSSTVTNTAGSITSSVRANASAGFSIVTYTGTGANATVGHGLGVAPSLVICKSRSNTFGNWGVWHTALLGTEYLLLNGSGAKAALANVWNSTIPTSTVFSVGTDVGVNNNGGSQLAYCFAPVSSYSAFGSYTGNGSADGPFVFCNFRPKYLLYKRSDSANAWVVFDSVRGTYNLNTPHLQPHLSSAESDVSTYGVDFLSNGFKLRSTDASMNASGGTYVYAAFAESPFQYARAR